MTLGERPRLQDSNALFVAAILGCAAIATGLVVGLARMASWWDLLWNLRYTPWLWLALGLASLALVIVLGFGLLALVWIPEMTGICAIALVGAAAPFFVVPVVAIVAGGTLLAMVRVRSRGAVTSDRSDRPKARARCGPGPRSARRPRSG